MRPWVADHATPWSEGLIRINSDIVTPANNGFWLVGLDQGEPLHTLNMDEATTDIVVEYRDDDIINDDNRLQWTVNFGECISAMETP